MEVVNRVIAMAAVPAALCAGLALSVSFAQAQAVKAPVKAPLAVEKPSYNWTGFYLGAGAGYGSNSFRDTWYTFDGSAWGSSPLASQGAFLTALAGYDLQVAPRLVVGVLADADFGGPKASFDAPGASSGFFKRNSAWSVGGRVGWLATPGTLVYVPAGFTQSRYSWVDSFFEFGADPVSRSATTQGWFAGLGLESRLDGNWSLRGEYRYAALGDICGGSSPGQTTPICRGADVYQGHIYRLEQFGEQSARVALAYRFQQGGAASGLRWDGDRTPRNWTGLYLGGGVGAGALNLHYATYHWLTGSQLSDADDGGGKGALATLQAGYDYKFAPQWVAGVFADFDFSRIGSRQVTSNGPASSSGAFNRDRAWSGGARLGWLAAPDTLFYVPVGFTQSHYAWDGAYFSYSFLDKKTFNGSLDGFFAGAGIETMFADHWSLRGEYRYAWLSGTACAGSTVIQQTPICKGVNDGVDYVLRAERFREQTVRAVVAYKFN